VDDLTSFYDAGRRLVLSEGIELDPRLGHYVSRPGAIFAENDFRKALRMTNSNAPKTAKSTTAAKEAFENGWKDGQVERFQLEAIRQDVLIRRMHERTIALISKERQRIAKELFS
jgi:hypothetical protein